MTQNLIKQCLQGHLDEVREVAQALAGESRTAIVRQLCQRLNFRDPRGHLQVAGCHKALIKMSLQGLVELPPARHKVGRPTPRRLDQAVAPPEQLPAAAEQIHSLRLVLVQGDEQLRTWNELVAREHPHGHKPLVGRQLRYLVQSEHGWLGAIGFGSCAKRLRQRDRWIGWDEALIAKHLDRVVGLNCLLLRPQAQCANLVSRVLGLAPQLFAQDFERLYGYRPWLLEALAGQEVHDEASWRAGGWLWVGGRGGHNSHGRAAAAPKEIYLCVLDEQFRQHMGIVLQEPPPPPPSLAPSQGMDSANWAANELGGAELGDQRLTSRLVRVAGQMGAAPGVAFCELVEGDRAQTAGYYRLLERPDSSAVTMEAIIAPHRERTLGRMRAQREVLCIHDTTDVNLATLESCKGLGVIGTNQTQTQTKGLSLHTSMVVEAGGGVALGILNCQCSAPLPKPERAGKDRRLIPAKDKETFRWIEAVDACMQATSQELSDTQVIHVTDREADFFEYFHFWSTRQSGDHLIVRAKHNRTQPEGQKMFDIIGLLPPQGQLQVEIPRKSARPKKGGKPARPPRAARTAVLELRWMTVVLSPPSYGPSSAHPPVRVQLLHVRENAPPPEGEEPLEWFLLTTLEIDSEETAARIVSYYAKRWRIEEWHRVLKTCCRCEEHCPGDANFIKRLLAVNMVIAWRILLMTLLGREAPELPMESLFSDLEICVIKAVAKRSRLAPPQSLGDSIGVVARLGGYLNRRSDPPPGAQILWRGLARLTSMCDGFSLAETAHPGG